MNDPAQGSPSPPWWRRPWPVGLLGLALMLGGWKLADFIPPAEPTAPAPRGPITPPFAPAGRLAMWFGVALFVTAWFLAARSPPAPRVPSPDEEEAGSPDEDGGRDEEL